MTPGSRVVTALPSAAVGQVRQSRRRAAAAARQGWSRWLGEPRNNVFLVLATAVAVGGGRKLLQWWRARASVAQLSESQPTVEAVEAASTHGRAALMDLFRILTTADSEPVRQAAGRALAALWAQDNLIVEEEKALILRGFAAQWRARRRYPRRLQGTIPITVSYGVPFLRRRAGEVGPENLEWSHRILGTRRAAHESFTPWTAGAAHAEFELIPGDFDSNGPHRLVLHPRVRTTGLTDSWELDLPQVPFHVEFDPALTPEALFTLADAAREDAIVRSIRLEPPAPRDGETVGYLPLNDEFAFRAPPELVVATPLPCDLAHRLDLEIDGVPGRFHAGPIVLSGQGLDPAAPSTTQRFSIGRVDGAPRDAIERPGTRRIRVVLTADPDRGWGDPDVRSIWPGALATDWVEVEVVRR